jgi:RIO kinase 2
MIDGAELYHYSELPDAKSVLDEIFVNIKKAYHDAHIIHGDLSSFNIILKSNMHILIIDWPQNVSTTHSNAAILLERDVQNVLTFFKRKYKINKELNDALTFVREDCKN